MSAKGPLLRSLAPLFKKAEDHGLWFHSRYQDLWFSPSELRHEHENDRLLFSAENWQLKNPQLQIDYLESKVRSAEKDLENFKRRVARCRT